MISDIRHRGKFESLGIDCRYTTPFLNAGDNNQQMRIQPQTQHHPGSNCIDEYRTALTFTGKTHTTKEIVDAD